MTRLFFYIVVLSTILVGCKASKSITNNSSTENLKTAEIISKYHKNNTTYTSLKAALNIRLKTTEKEENLTASLRVLKNEKIWLSIGKMGIPGAKILISPNTVKYYNKIDNTFFDGDYSIINSWLKTNVTFMQLQGILLGEAMYTLEPTQYDSEILENGYLLRPEQLNPLAEHYITLNPGNFKVKSQEIAQPKAYRILTADYQKYQEVDKQLIPLLINMLIVEKTSETQIDISYRNVSLNQDLRFPFKIPNNYKEISIEN